MKTKETKLQELRQELAALKRALADKSISVNEYSSFYYSTSKQIKQLENQ